MGMSRGLCRGALAAAALLVAVAYVVWSPRPPAGAADQEAAKPAVRWEYCTLSNDHEGKCIYHTSGEAVGAENWKEMARKLKAPLKEEDQAERTARVVVFDHLGAQGWELTGQSAIAVNATFVETFTFKRRLP
jgi:hypothetical protein